jgi:hypothetical protein
MLGTGDEPGTILNLGIKWGDVHREAEILTDQRQKL